MNNFKCNWSNLAEMLDGSRNDIQYYSVTIACSGDSMKCPCQISTIITDDVIEPFLKKKIN